MNALPDFLRALRPRFSGDLRLDAASKVLYSTDASLYQIEPLGVAIPKTQEDLCAAVELAAKHKIPILPRGAGSSLAGQAIGEALILDLSRHLDSIVEIDPESRTAVVEPGVVLADLNKAAATFGLTFGPDPASAERATMGGIIGNNAAGAHSILYGMTADHLISADVILSDGSRTTWGEEHAERSGRSAQILKAAETIREKYADLIRQKFPKSWRNSAGYRVNYLLPYSPSKPPQWQGDYPRSSSSVLPASLLAGSEGTLAVVRRAKVNLVPKPKHTILGVLAYESVAAACDDVPRLLEFQPSAIELIPQMILRLARGVPAYAREAAWVQGDPAAVLAVEFSGDDPQKIREEVKRVGTLMVVAESKEEQARVWNTRKMGLGILDSRPQAARPAAFIEDCAVPVENLGAFVREAERIMREHGTEGGIYAHASAGCLHIRPVLNLQRRAGIRALRSVGEQIFQVVFQLGGSMSSEHGDGIARGEWIEKTYGKELTEAMRLLKRAADPDGILNPRKMFDAPPLDSHLRYGEHYQTRTWTPALHFDHERGLAGAIEQCNGQGVCRKTTGVMCPSFQATREEANSTRGRANLLRGWTAGETLGIRNCNGQDTGYEIQDAAYERAVFNALDLCLACKGCASECPSGVDMPKLKYEFMNEYFKTHRRPLRDYLFGYFDVVSKWLSPIAPIANAFMKMNWSRKMIARVTGVASSRPFPVYRQFPTTRYKSPVHFESPKVLFLSDVFSRYLEPEVEETAFQILRAAGYEIEILAGVGAGTSLLSKGFIEAAKKRAEKLLDAILAAGENLPVVGCEPPEIYCLKRDYFALLPRRRAEIESVARRVWLLDEFLLRNANLEALIEKSAGEKVFFHPHCHQRAEGPAEDGLPSGTSATVAMLKACGYEVELSEAGCCGMAGTFGYDAEHYELSMRIGELKLLPKVRVAEKRIVSSGSACRLQIQHGAGKESAHPLTLVARLLKR